MTDIDTIENLDIYEFAKYLLDIISDQIRDKPFRGFIMRVLRKRLYDLKEEK